MAVPVEIVVKEEFGFARTGEPVSVGIPFALGQCAAGTSFQLTDDNGNPVSASFSTSCLWPDGSIRWLLVEFLFSVQPHQTRTLTLTGQSSALATAPVPITPTPEGWRIATQVGDVTLGTGLPMWEFSGATSSRKSIVRLSDADEQSSTFRPDGDWEVVHQNSLYTEASLKGQWLRADNKPLMNFCCRLRIYTATGLAMVETQIHNPNRARHAGGLWDLGDPGSVYFRALEVITETGLSDTATLRPDALHLPEQTTTSTVLDLYQDSSGGENWNSRNHIDKNGNLTVRFRGYKLTSDSTPEQSGHRANPLLSLSGAQGALHVAVPTFWQNFPSGLSYRDGAVKVGLFPPMLDNQLYELQGGERKTLTHIMAYNSSSDLRWAYAPLLPRLAPEVYEATGAFPWFKANAPKTELDDLIQSGLDGPSNFFEKREVIDEYGWRNFGDIFADHESLYQPPGEAPLISHYNNQYDAIYGFARQFALTGDRRWFELMDDLARHVTDIDIYHTQEDRAEYNNGLFWHTDHYLPAHTATHRTFSQHNDTSSTPGQTGGGPAAEHCYTTGLLYHFLMTGDPDSRSSILNLARWMVNLHDGSHGLLAQLLVVKKEETPRLKALIRGERPSSHRYPFTRGTGNYLVALLDAAILEPEKGWLQKAGQVIRETIHPADDIEARNLLDVEIGWSYLILLAAIFRYVRIKQEMDETDETYHYACQSLLRYTAWMRSNERPFLQDPDPLEFANDTWVAQDIRKAMLMFNATELCQGKEAEACLATGQQWLDQACHTLKASPEKHFSRIQIILAQNYGPQTTASLTGAATGEISHFMKEAPAPLLTWPRLVARILQRLGIGFAQFRPAREKAWLDARLNR